MIQISVVNFRDASVLYRFVFWLYKVDDFGTNQNCVCDFLLLGHSDYCPVLHRFRDLLVKYQLFFLLDASTPFSSPFILFLNILMTIFSYGYFYLNFT